MSDQEDIFRKFAEAEKRAGENVNPNDLLTKQEIHEFGIDIIYKYSQQEGYEIVDGTTDLNLNPQLVLKKNGQLYFVMVKTGPADGTHLNYDKDLALQVFNNAKPHNAKVLFAGVGLSTWTLSVDSNVYNLSDKKIQFHKTKTLRNLLLRRDLGWLLHRS